MEKRNTMMTMTKESVKQILIEAARLKTPLRYFEVLNKHNLAWNKQRRLRLLNILIEIGEEQYESGKPFLNVLVVGEIGIPGIGFFTRYEKATGISIPLNDHSFLKNLTEELIEDCHNYYFLPAKNAA